MPEYRVTSLHLTSGARVAEIPITDLRYGTSYVSGLIVGYVSGKLHLPELATPADRIRAAVYNDAVEENLRHLFVERDGVVVGDGIVWASPCDDSGAVRTINAGSAVTYLNRRRIRVRRTFTGADQFTIARTLISDAIDETNGNVGISLGAETSGVTRDRTYETWDVKNLGEALEQLASVENGFDLSIDCSWDPATGDPIKLLRLHYPRRGRPQSQSQLVFEQGRNMTFNWPSDGTMTSNRLYGVGDGMEDDMLMSVQTDPASLALGYPILEGDFSAKSVRLQATLDSHTKAELAARSKPAVFPTMNVNPNLDPPLGGYVVGDTCKIIVRPGDYPRFPNGLETYRRIVAIDVAVDDEGTETVKVTTGEEP